MTTVQKRLHISGLTPAISEDDVQARLQNFVNVKAIDGFGKLNALGEPRKFAYATVDGTEQNLARCLNHLSGTIWKGARLRIGEAKPDYLQRLEKEREQQELESPKKRQRLPRGVQGVHAKDMSPVTLENVDSRPGWQKTTLLHLVRPMKMRPSRPLPPFPTNSHQEGKIKRTHKRLRSATRPPIQKVDPRLWDPVHVTGNMLQSIVIAPSAPSTEKTKVNIPLANSRSAENTVSASKPLNYELPSPTVVGGSPLVPIQRIPTATLGTEPIQGVTYSPMEGVIEADIQDENARHLALLSDMFGDSSNDWNGQEAIEDDSGSLDETRAQEYANNVELSEPLSNPKAPLDNYNVMKGGGEILDKSLTESDRRESREPDQAHQRTPSPASKGSAKLHEPKGRSLKDLFKPQENAGFSLLANLDLDLDLDLDFDLDLDPTSNVSKPTETRNPSLAPPQTEAMVQPSLMTYHHDGFTLDSNLPLFFPRPDNPRSKDLDLVSISKTQGWRFYRTDDSDTIRRRWDDIKGGLTHEWKKRSREAVKARKRRFGAEAFEEP